MDRWVEHYAKLYGRGNTLTDTAYEAIETLTSMPELDEPPNELELSKVIDCLHTGKAPGLNSIPPEFIKCAKSTLLGPLHKLLCQCWEEGEVPQGSIRTRRTGVTVTTTGESPFWTLLVRSLLVWSSTDCRSLSRESQCGFRAERSTADMVVSLQRTATVHCIHWRHKSIWPCASSPRSDALPNCWPSSSHSARTWRVWCSLMELPLSPSVSASEWSRDAYLLPHCSAFSLLSSSNKPLAPLKKVSTSIPIQTESFSTSLGSRPRPRFRRCWSGTCLSQMMQLLFLTQNSNSRHSWTASLAPARTSGWPSVSKRPTWWPRMLNNRHPSQSIAACWMSSMSSLTWAPQWGTTSPWTLRSADALAKQPQLSPDCPNEFGKTKSWPLTPKQLCTEHASSAPSSMVASPGLFTLAKRDGSTHSTWGT